MNTCHVSVPTATVYLEDVGIACMVRSFCASTNCGAGTSKRGTFCFERGGQNLWGGGGSATVCHFGKSHDPFLLVMHLELPL